MGCQCDRYRKCDRCHEIEQEYAMKGRTPPPGTTGGERERALREIVVQATVEAIHQTGDRAAQALIQQMATKIMQRFCGTPDQPGEREQVLEAALREIAALQHSPSETVDAFFAAVDIAERVLRGTPDHG